MAGQRSAGLRTGWAADRARPEGHARNAPTVAVVPPPRSAGWRAGEPDDMKVPILRSGPTATTWRMARDWLSDGTRVGQPGRIRRGQSPAQVAAPRGAGALVSAPLRLRPSRAPAWG